MTVTTYTVYDFKYNDAIQGVLVAMVLNTVAPNTQVAQDADTLKGVGTVKVTSQNTITLTINSIVYSFNNNGICISKDYTNYKLMLAEVQEKASEVGSGVETDGTVTVGTRSSDGTINYREEQGNSIIISSLEARDQFALYALKTLMEKATNDVASMSDNEKMHLCKSAYQWAANMMTQASKARAVIITDDTELNDYSEKVNVDPSELTVTSNKLFNNILVALERTDFKETIEVEGVPKDEFSERVINPKINNKLKEFLKATKDSEDDTKIEPLKYEKPDKDEKDIKFWEYEALIKLFRRVQAKKEETTDEDFPEDEDKPVFLDRVLIPELRGSLLRTEDPSDDSTTYVRVEEFLDIYKNYVKHIPEEGEPETKTTVGFDDFLKILKNVQYSEQIEEDTEYSERIINPKLNALIENYVKHTPGEGEPTTKTTVGLDDLIKAIETLGSNGITIDFSTLISALTSLNETQVTSIGDVGLGRDQDHPFYISNGEGGSTEVDFTPLIDAINAKQVAGEIITQFGNDGLGRDSSHPIYISGGSFPSRQVLAAAFTEGIIHDFLTFNEAGAVGYSTKAETAKAVWSQISAEDIWSKIQATVDSRIKAWLNATTIVADGSGWKLNVPNNI